MPIGQVIGEYWKDWNKRDAAGQIPAWQSIPLNNLSPGPAIGNFYQSIQEGNPNGAYVSGVSAALPWLAKMQFLKSFQFGQLPLAQRLVGGNRQSVAQGLKKQTAWAGLGNFSLGEGSDIATQNPIDISFGSKEGGSHE